MLEKELNINVGLGKEELPNLTIDEIQEKVKEFNKEQERLFNEKFKEEKEE